MGILAVDILIKSMLEAAIADMRANTWILEDVFSGLASDPMAAPEAGWKEVQAAMKWFLSTDIPVIMQYRIADRPKIPCISVAYGPSSEMQERASFADDGMIEDYNITGAGNKAVTQLRITGKFTPDNYNPETGQVTMPKSVNTSQVAEGQYLVTKSGKNHQIQAVDGKYKFSIKPGTTDDLTDCYIAPKSTVWNLHKELTYFNESYSIGCHTQNDPATTIWLWQIVAYSFLRYKEAYLEGRCLELTTFQSSALQRNGEFPAENVFSKYITITGQVQADWIKFAAPKFEKTVGHIIVNDQNPPTLDVYNDDIENCEPLWSSGDSYMEYLAGEENNGEPDEDC